MDKLNMRATLNIYDDLYAQAVELTGEHEKNALVREGLLALVEREGPNAWHCWAIPSLTWRRYRAGNPAHAINEPGIGSIPRSGSIICAIKMICWLFCSIIIRYWCISMVRSELACGNLRHRLQILTLLKNLPHVSEATHEKLWFAWSINNWWGVVFWFLDVHLLAATLLTPGTCLWTRDSCLAAVAQIWILPGHQMPPREDFFQPATLNRRL